MIAGSFTSFNGIDAGRIIRLKIVMDYVMLLLMRVQGLLVVYMQPQQADGKIIVVGSFTKYNTTTQTEWF
jgi:hypothetical protein